MNAIITTKEQEKEIVDLYNQGLSMKAIAKMFSVSTTPVERVLRLAGAKKHPFGSWVSGVPKTTNQKQEEEIVNKYINGLSKESISRDMNIGKMVVERVLKDRNVKMRSCGGVRPYDVRGNCFDNLGNEHSAYWLGFLFAEIGIHRSNINLALSAKDVDHLLLWRDFIGCQKPIKEFNVGMYKVVRLDVSDRPLADKMRELGIESNRPNGVGLLSKIPRTSVHHFLRGWFDGDGSAYKFPQLCFAGREPFLIEVQKIFIENANANQVTLKSNGSKVIKMLVYKGVNRCNEIANYLYKDATIWLSRKRDRINSWPPPKNVRNKRFWD